MKRCILFLLILIFLKESEGVEARKKYKQEKNKPSSQTEGGSAAKTKLPFTGRTEGGEPASKNIFPKTTDSKSTYEKAKEDGNSDFEGSSIDDLDLSGYLPDSTPKTRNNPVATGSVPSKYSTEKSKDINNTNVKPAEISKPADAAASILPVTNVKPFTEVPVIKAAPVPVTAPTTVTFPQPVTLPATGTPPVTTVSNVIVEPLITNTDEVPNNPTIVPSSTSTTYNFNLNSNNDISDVNFDHENDLPTGPVPSNDTAINRDNDTPTSTDITIKIQPTDDKDTKDEKDEKTVKIVPKQEINADKPIAVNAVNKNNASESTSTVQQGSLLPAISSVFIANRTEQPVEASPEDQKDILAILQKVLLYLAGVTFLAILLYSVYYVNLIRRIYAKKVSDYKKRRALDAI